MQCPTNLHDTQGTILLKALVPVAALDGRTSKLILPDVTVAGNPHADLPRPVVNTIFFRTYRQFLYFIDFCYAMHPDTVRIPSIDSIREDWNKWHYAGIGKDNRLEFYDNLQPYIASTGLAQSPAFLLDAQTTHMIANGVPYASIIDHLTSPA